MIFAEEASGEQHAVQSALGHFRYVAQRMQLGPGAAKRALKIQYGQN